MAAHDQVILDASGQKYVVGDDLEIRRTVTTPPSAIARAWLTIKRHRNLTDEQASLKKEITVTNVEGTGQIVAAGDPMTDGDLRFDLTAANTLALGPVPYVYDIQVQLADDRVNTIEDGTLELADQVTRAAAV